MKLSILSTSKRVRFIFISLILTSGLVLLSCPPYDTQVQWIFFLALLALFFTNLILGGTSGIEKFTLLLLPATLTLGAGLSQFFFPNFTTVFKVGGWVSFFLAFYITLLALNIFKVIRLRGETIPLERVARPTAFLLSFVAVFLLLTAVYKFSYGVWIEVPLVFLIGFILSLSFLWTLTLSDLFEREHLLGSLLVGLGLAQVSIALSFYPWEAFLRGLTEATFFYALLGVARAYFEKHLKYSIVFEYAVLALIVFFVARVF
jgi:hypothetical protein